MSRDACALGLDFGTNSCRAVVVDLASGVELGEHVAFYPSGDSGIVYSAANPLVARQQPADYRYALEAATVGALDAAEAARRGFTRTAIAGIGVATTGSTPLPLDAGARPLSDSPAFSDDIDAFAWLWKDHSALAEAEEITSMARALRPSYLSACGGVYSAEWFWAKVLHCFRTAPAVFAAAETWVELCDFIPAVLIGVDDASEVPRSLCAAGHKAMYSQRWGGLPDAEFLAALEPELTRLRERLYTTALEAGTPAGGLGREWSDRTGLPIGTTVAIGSFDAHAAALAAGVAEGVLVKVMGTSTCDVTVRPLPFLLDELPGVCGVVPGSVAPGTVGIEAGQSGVGDAFRWFAERFAPAEDGATPDERIATLSARAAALGPGENGLIALDWLNGNRSILVDHRLSGLIVGLNLDTKPHHILAALVEATAFGARRIVDRLEEYGVHIDQVVATGGLPHRNPSLVQTYADVLGLPIRVTASSQCSALGAALLGALAAGVYDSVEAGQDRLVRFADVEYRPLEHAGQVYDQLYKIFGRLHDAFGGVDPDSGLANVMHELLQLRLGRTLVR